LRFFLDKPYKRYYIVYINAGHHSRDPRANMREDRIEKMSCYIVEDATINNIVNALFYQHDIHEKCVYAMRRKATVFSGITAEDLAKCMAEINFMAVNYRYQERAEKMIGDSYEYSRTFKRLDMVQFFKSLQCFLYQCDEGDINQTPLFKALEYVANDMASHIVHGLAEYKEANWC